MFFFFLSGIPYMDTDNSQDNMERKRTIFYSTLPLPSTHENLDIYLQLCTWDDYQVFLIAPLVFTRLLLDEIYHLIELLFQIDDVMLIFVCLLDDLILGCCYSNLKKETGISGISKMEAINLTKVSIWPKKAGYYKHKNLLSHIKLRKKNLMFGDIEIEKK